MHILIAEDNLQLAANIADYLENQGFTTDFAADGLTALHLASTGDYAALVLDLGLPRCSGNEVCKRLRASQIDMPILVLTACDELDSTLDLLNAGADDYLVKPIAMSELAARIRAKVRRNRGELTQRCLQVSDLSLDETTLEVHRGGRRLTLTRIDFLLLKLLMKTSPGVVSRARIEQEIWGDDPPQSDSLRAHIHRLRRTVDGPGEVPLLHTVHGFGYRLAENHETA